MAKKFKMVLYGEPGTGKSVFACKADRPFFITTDGNYEWLEDFGAKDQDHIQVYSWEEAKKAFKRDFSNYNTIVVDLVEDMFKWCEQEYCKRQGFEHVSDIGFGKGYDITRNDFFIEIAKLLELPKNIILISHGITFTVKDRRGVEHTRYAPSSRIPDKVWDMIEGRVRYFLRCYEKAEEDAQGKITKYRYLSLIPKENEFGIARGLDETSVAHDITLDYDTFINCIGLSKETNEKTETKVEPKKVEKVVEPTTKEEIKEVKVEDSVSVEVEVPVEKIKEVKVEETKTKETNIEETKAEEPVVNTTKKLSNTEAIEAIKAKLAAMKKK